MLTEISVSGMFRMHMLTKTLAMLQMELMSCGKDCPMNCRSVSVSLV